MTGMDRAALTAFAVCVLILAVPLTLTLTR